MLLYDKNGKSIDIYSIDYNKEEMLDFKIQKMKLIPEEEQINFAIDINHKFSNYVKDKTELSIPVSKKTKKQFYIVPKNSKNFTQYLNLYYKGIYDNFKGLTSLDYRKIKYYILNLNNPNYVKDKEIISPIIQVPEILYYLQLILNEDFKQLKDKNINELLELFTLNQIEELDINNLHGRHSIIRKGNLDDAIKKANNDKILLKKLTRK